MSDSPSRTDELPESTPELPKSALDSDRYRHLSLDNGSVVIYDRNEPETWLQSDFAVEIGG